jgi:hypothetical protein
MNATAPPPAAAEPGAVSLDAFFERVRTVNPFLDNRVNGPTADSGVETIHHEAFARLTDLARQAYAARRGVGAVLWGEAGIGKSHLLARLARWGARGANASLVYLHNLQASPDNLPRSLLKAVVSLLTAGRVSQLRTTPLFHLTLAAVGEALGHDATRRHPWREARQAYHQLLDRLGTGAAPLDRTVYEVLFRFFHSAYRARNTAEDAVAALAVRWLAGDALDPDEAGLLALPPGRTRAAPMALEDNQRIKQVLVALTQLAAWRRQPFVLCFDQVDNLDEEQMAALARFLEALIDSSPNLLVVTAGIQASLVRWREEHVIQASAWDRLAQFEIPLHRISAAAGRQLVGERAVRFVEPFAEVEAVRRRLHEDDLFPLGRPWADGYFRDKIEMRPRDVINGAREGWQQQQERLRQQGGPAWLAAWPGQPSADGVPPLTPEQIREAIDRQVTEKMTAYRRLRSSEALPPDADNLAGLVFKLLEQWRTVDPACGIQAVERAGPAYHLLVRRGEPLTRGEDRVGILFLVTGSAKGTAPAIRRLADDAEPPQRVLLITDARQPPRFAARGNEYREQLRQRGRQHFQEVSLPFAEYADLDALQAVVGLAQSGDLEIALPAGQTRRVTAQEVIESHQRQGRYRAAAVLRELLRP